MSTSARRKFAEVPQGERSLFARSQGISRSTLYYKLRQPVKDRELKTRIETILQKHKNYGYRRIRLAFKKAGIKMNKKRIARVMRLYGLRPRTWRKRRKRPRNKGHPDVTVPNLRPHLTPLAPNVIWAGDFTELSFHGRRAYLATVIDIWTREILGWAFGLRHTSRLVLEAMEDAKRRRGGLLPWIFHSDQGSEYTSNESTFWLVSHGIRPSCSPKGKPWKNGHQESWYATMKKEMDPASPRETIEDFYTRIAQFIRYYNEERIHGEIEEIPAEQYTTWLKRDKGSLSWGPEHLGF